MPTPEVPGLSVKLDCVPSFLTDAMLGKLTRWLRVLGYDTSFNPAQEDHDLVRVANAQQRVLLTRDRHLIEFLRPAYGLLINSNKPLQQLGEVVERLELRPSGVLFTRCLICNTPLRPATAAETAVELPADIDPEQARLCPGCRRLYWHGSHTQRMRESVERVFAG